MKFRVFLISALLLLNTTVNAQSDFKPGYVIDNSGDTIYGALDYRGDKMMGKLCRFKINENIREYSPEEISAFRFTDSKFFISSNVLNKKVFLEYLIKGKISMYYLRDENGDHYFLEKDGQGFIEIPYEEKTVCIDKKLVSYKSTKHIGLLSYYMQEAPEISKEINRIKEPTPESLINVAEDYNNLVCKDQKCIIYEKKNTKEKIFPEIAISLVHYNKSESIYNKYYLQAGVLVNVWVPRLNEKLYIRTGFQYTEYYWDYNERLKLLSVPLQLEYIYPKHSIMPKFAYGFNFTKNDFFLQLITCGANIKVSKSVYLSTTANVNLLIPSFLYYNSTFEFGLFINM